MKTRLYVTGTGTAGTYMYAENCTTSADAVINGDHVTSSSAQMPDPIQSQTTMYYESTGIYMYFNAQVKFSSGSSSLFTICCYLKAMRIA